MNNKPLYLLMLLLCAGLHAERRDFGTQWRFWSDTNPDRQAVTIPHDAMLTEHRSAEGATSFGAGYFDGNVYHYEKTLNVPVQWLGKHVSLFFEGLYRNATVFVNGRKAATHAYGYTPFEVSLDGFLHEGENTVRVDADNSKVPNIRWYSGAGIIRPVWLDVRNIDYIEDVKVETLSINPARISVRTVAKSAEVKVKILYKGRVVAKAVGGNVELEIPDARLWSAETPDLYTAQVSIKGDSQSVEFGIRKIEWSSMGFYVNGENVLLKGTGLHSDNGVLGACEYEGAALRKVSILKSFGFNAIRSAHNPISAEMLRACDQLGMYVMDEFWDGWYDAKMSEDYHSDFPDNYEEDIKSTVDNDFNHPSVVMYSIGNELSEPATAFGQSLGEKIVALVHSLDNTRPVTCGVNLDILSGAAKKAKEATAQGKDEQVAATENMQKLIAALLTPISGAKSSIEFNETNAQNGFKSNENLKTDEVDSLVSPFLDILDIAGYNYGEPRYSIEGRKHPERIIVGTETTIGKIYDNWQSVNALPYLIGDFVWTGWDYLGETGAGAWRYGTSSLFAQPYPWLLGCFGTIDILGNPGGEAFLVKTLYGQARQKPYICVRPIREDEPYRSSWRLTNSIPSWSWRGCEGQTAVVEVFTDAPEVELFLDGKTLGKSKTIKNIATFSVPYKSGKLEAYAIYEDGDKTCSSLESSTGSLTLAAKAEKSGELVYVDIDIQGENAVTETMADRELRVSVDGGELLGFGSALPYPEGYDFRSGVYPSWQGKAQAVIRPSAGGKVTLTVSGEGLESKIITY